MFPGFVFIRYDKRTGTETAFERRVDYSQFPRGRGMPCRITCGSTRVDQMAEGLKGIWAKACIEVFKGRNG